MFIRDVATHVVSRLDRQKVIVLLGPRQVGKTTLVRRIAAEQELPFLYLNADDVEVPELLAKRSAAALRSVIGNHQLIIIDEAQRVAEIGLKLKLLVDTYPEIQLIVTGSSSLDLSRGVNESLTGRKFEFFLYPISFAEYYRSVGHIAAMGNLERRLLYGSYPEVINQAGDEREYLLLLVNSYLYKDLLDLKELRRTELLVKILQSLAFQVGSEVSYNEVANNVGADRLTVERYIDLLEKAFVVFRLPAFSRNLRNEIKKGRKIYFWDNGVRNALISNFSPLSLRADKGALWENFLVSERAKHNQYSRNYANAYFWRTHRQQEIDYLEDRDGQLRAFEFTYNPKKKKKLPHTFTEAYPNSTAAVINSDNFLPFVGIADE